MGIRDMAAEAAETTAAAKAAEDKRKLEARNRALHAEVIAWATERLLPPDEVIVFPHNHAGDWAIFRIDDVWMRYYRTPPKEHYQEDKAPAAALVWLLEQTYTVNKPTEKVVKRYHWEEILDVKYYVFRSMAGLGNQLEKAKGKKPSSSFYKLVDPAKFKGKVDKTP